MQKTQCRNNSTGIQQKFPIQKQYRKKTKPNILTHSIQTIQTKTKNTMPNTRNKPDNTGRIIHKSKQLLRQRHTTRIPRKRGGG